MLFNSTKISQTIWSSLLGLALCAGAGCQGWAPEELELGFSEHAIVDVPHTPVERQSIGNCWLYAQASWVESVHLAARLGGTAEQEELDVSQSYWTYWHWFDQVTGYMWEEEISTGGNQWQSHAIVRDRGLMREIDFIPEDSASEMSMRQAAAKDKINAALKTGVLSTDEARKDGVLVRQVFDDAWGLSENVRAQLDQAFGDDGERTLRSGGSVAGTQILDPNTVKVSYMEPGSDGQTVRRQGTLVEAIRGWKTVRYPSDAPQRRSFLQRVQRALHDRQPVVITWDVDFNALENYDEQRRGSFNLQTLQDAGGPGRQGGHMTVLEDYAAITEEFGLLEAAQTLDPQDPEDAAKLEALLLPSTQITLLRTKNSWGADRPDRQFATGFPGYHDLWMDYLNGPIRFCPSVEDDKTEENCSGETNPLNSVMLPPGY
jgi:hypothetical protein